MSTVVYNPTNEMFEAQYVGEYIIIKAGAKLKMDDPRARHILNELGQRGLCRLEYGDKEEPIAAAGIKRNKAFKLKQIMNYNQMNEARRQQNQSYMEVPEFIEEYANELGVGVIKPYNIKDTEREELASVRAERDEQKKQIAGLQAMMQRLLDAQEAGNRVDPDESKEETEIETNRLKYKRLGQKTMQAWIDNNKEEIAAWPEENLTEVRKKYLGFYGQELNM